jgi:hypothetical protein
MMADGTEQVINKKQFAALLKDVLLKKKRMQSIAGELGERIKEGCDNGHLNRKAFSMIRAIASMDEEKRDDVLRSFDLYRDYCESEHFFGEKHLGDLAEQAEREAAADRDADAADKKYERAAGLEAIKKGIKPITEDASLGLAEAALTALAKFDDSTSSKPSRRSQKDVLEGGDKSGSYKLQ